MSKNYSVFETRVLSLFSLNTIFSYQNIEYKVIKSGKPRPYRGGGECKTDCYILLEDTNSGLQKELKISCKIRSSNEFQENKISAGRAKEIFGPQWESIIETHAKSLENNFKNITLNNPQGRGRLRYGHIILGWKLEIASKARTLSKKLELPKQTIIEYIYKGINQTQEKKDSVIDSRIIKESGVANYILVADLDEILTIEDVLNNMTYLDNYIIKDHYLIFTSNSYNIGKNKTDGNRPLAVRVEWSYKDEELIAEIKFDNPLSEISKSLPMKKKVDEILNHNPHIKELYIDSN
ncbi:hypothetical protein [Macrococcus lamae]|uniref:Uncharacterized protein n=1 Tax=Macrococcus lamae TaxID=198484 RepID=A0A4R6BTV9_9STAP|nr:hypothetical protein [Macrococcus lamae]TDM07719.1 hypothetical protein ERX29_08225 [Macrococcus lamae]